MRAVVYSIWRASLKFISSLMALISGESPQRAACCPFREPCFRNDLFLRERFLVLKHGENELRAWWKITKPLVNLVTHYQVQYP